MNHFSAEGRLALVTGATRGIGFAAASALATAGADVVLVGRNHDEIQQAAERIRPTGRKVHVSVFDLQRTSDIAAWFISLCEQTGTPNILVNSAGISRRGTAIELALEDWEAVMAVNTTAIFELSRAFAKRLIHEQRDGKVINLASLMTSAARPGTSAYTASKGAVGQLTKALAVEWAQHGILVNAIAPGYINTNLNKTLAADPRFDAWVKQRCPLGRWGTPDDIAWPIVFLATAASDFITGQTIYVDGGWLATF